MKLAVSSKISKIDEYSSTSLGISLLELMDRSGAAVERVVREKVEKGGKVVVLAGKGNNGGDAYAAAVRLFDSYNIVIYDIFAAGQKTAEGTHFRERFISLGGEVRNYSNNKETTAQIKSSDCIIDAVFGTGFHGEMPENIRPLAIAVRETVGAYKIAVDVPLGINADDGSVSDFAITVSATVELSYIKPGIVSYPARSYVGEIFYDDLGLPMDTLSEMFEFNYNTIDKKWAADNLPRRAENSNKGTFGKLLLITGSNKYKGAAYLTAEAALRGGVGLVTYHGTRELSSALIEKYPEIIYNIAKDDDTDFSSVTALSAKHAATLVGSGSGNTEYVRELTKALLASDGGVLILDADAINALAGLGEEGIALIKASKRKIIITPHPLEFARLTGQDVATVQEHRLEQSRKFAKENKCIVILKGAGTIVTSGNETYINTSGSSALAKAGSGDVLAGLVGALSAMMDKNDLLSAAALAVYYHGAAGDALSEGFSSYGVTPSDLPCEIARQIAITEKERNNK